MQTTTSFEKTKTAASIGSLGLAVLGFVHGEAWIIVAVTLLGPLWSYIALAAAATLAANSVIYVLETKAKIHLVERLRERVIHRQARLSPLLQKTIRVSKTTGILTTSVFLGAIPTAFLIHALGYKRPSNYLLATLCSLLFVSVWVSIYSGIVLGLESMIAQM